MKFFPLCLSLSASPCLLVGGGDIALRKAMLIAKAGASIVVVAPKISNEFDAIISQHGGKLKRREYRAGEAESYRIVIAATDDHELNAQVSADAMSAGALVNVVDAPSLSNFIFPAIVDRSPLVIAISSGGASPVLSRYVRSKVEYTVPAAYGQLAEFIGQHREYVAERLPKINQRRLFWEDIVKSEVAERVMMGRTDEAEVLLRARLDNSSANECGEVYLIGAGPGDPDLMTFKALRLLQRADVVLYDRLVAPEIVEMARRDAERVYVGKARADHALPQVNINHLLVDLAQQGKKVARLKGGDPFVFGRGGEEIASLMQLDIPFQVIPGISAANGCACYAGIPLTHRDYAQSVRFLTGNLKNNQADLPWSELLATNETLVIYMGLIALPSITKSLMRHGRAGDTPIALVERGTTPFQRVHTATLATIEAQIANREVHAPTLMIIGDVVKLHATLSWRSHATPPGGEV